MYHHVLRPQPGQLRALQRYGLPLSAGSSLSASFCPSLQRSTLLHPCPLPHSDARVATFHSSSSTFSPRFSSSSSSFTSLSTFSTPSTFHPVRSMVTGSHQQSTMQLGATSPHDVGLVLAAASAGNVEQMKEALAHGTCTVNDGDYDRRKVHTQRTRTCARPRLPLRLSPRLPSLCCVW